MIVFRYAVVLIMALVLNGCSISHNIKRADQSDSALKDAVYTGNTQVLVEAAVLESFPLSEQYRVYELNWNIFAIGGLQRARNGATERMIEFCKDMKMVPKVLIEQTSVPAYMAGNYPFIEITFACVDKSRTFTSAKSGDDRIKKLIQLKSLLDSNALTQEEYDKEKSRILNN
jgi:hypothetical protein